MSLLRTSGDIDLFVKGEQIDIIRYLQKEEPEIQWDYVHAHYHVYDETEVEVHYRPCVLYNLIRNRKLQKWFKDNLNEEKLSLDEGEIIVSSSKFNRLFLLVHAYHHLLNGGIGLRQIMDYYFVVKKQPPTEDEKNEFEDTLRMFGLTRFASSIMWIMQEVFGLGNQYLLLKPNAAEGAFLLNEIMEGATSAIMIRDIRKGIRITVEDYCY